MRKLNRNGQALVEYVLIIAIISVIAVALVNYFGGYLKDAFQKTACSIVGQEYEKGDKPGEGHCIEEDDEQKDGNLE